MARAGRPRNTIQRVHTHVSLLPEHHKKLDLLDWDPFLERRTAGMRNKHFDRALEEYFQKYYPDLEKKDG